MKMLPPIRQSVPDSDPCYWCGGSANSDEHVPPKGIFPELKDIPEKDLRFNLLTVRSCEEHNQRKSNNDEYLMAVITPVLGNNKISIKQTDTKIKRALERNGGSLEKAAYIGLEEYSEVINGQERICARGNIDIKRFFDSIEPIARAIYRLHFDCRFSGKCLFFADFLILAIMWLLPQLRRFIRKFFERMCPIGRVMGRIQRCFIFRLIL